MLLALRDAEGYSRKLLLLSPIDALIAARLNGRASAKSIADDLAKQTGQPSFPVQRIHKLIQALDENLMLESKRFQTHKQRVLDDFRKAPERPPCLAGSGYENDAAALSATLESYHS